MDIQDLVAETSAGKPVQIEVCGVPLENIMPMPESIVIHNTDKLRS